MNKDKTVEEFYIEHYGVCPSIEKEIPLHSYKDMMEFAKEFAKLHVERSLKEASEKLQDDFLTLSGYEWAKKSILNSYPLNNIK